MNSQDFLKLILIVTVAFVAWYLHSFKGGKKPTQLNLKAGDSAPPLVSNSTSSDLPTGLSIKTGNTVSMGSVGQQFHPDYKNPEKAKSLNVLFNYNGHAWDAYEVLGVPAGASLPMVTEAYQKAVREQVAHQSLDFLETAYKAILARQ